MRGDWTQRDDVITNFLKSYNIVGVPAYFIQKPDGTIIPLGETISLGKLKEHTQN
jgi:thiol:disulfide interchange protein